METSLENECYACKKPMETEWIVALNTKFHPPCFVCVGCKKEISGEFFPVPDDNYRPACTECYNSAPLCAGCRKPLLLPNVLTAVTKKFHLTCLKCVNCKKDLRKEELFNVHNNPVCKSCLPMFELNV